ncbi:MAG: hypothetical protein HQK72_17685 [Desulfamplus sp.]|nr:hypothetical protein [Desulfamplus sp.]
MITVINEQQIKKLESYYNELDIGIIIINKALDFIFLNRWFIKRLSEELKSLWELKKTFNLKMLYGSDEADLNKKDKIEQIIVKVINEKSIIVLSQAFHEWIIPFNDKRFSDGKMRQTCIIKPYNSYKDMALVQIKNESDTVLKSRNLRQSKELIKKKNVELRLLNKELDITNKDLLLLNTELINREKYVKQKSKMEAIGRMAGGIVHDFKNYLFIILGNTELLMYEIPVTDPNYSCIEDIQKAANSAKSLIHEIATFRKSDIEECEIDESEEEYLNIDTVIQAQVALIKSMVSRIVAIDYSYNSSDECFVRASSSQLQRIFFNIVINAVHAICGDSLGINKICEELPIEGHIDITVKPVLIENRDEYSNIYDFLKKGGESGNINAIALYELKIPGKYVALTISDSGSGITPDNLEKIFDPYFTTKPSGKGSGIGLSVVLGIVKHLGGAIHVQSEVNKGTFFTVILPCQAEANVQKHGEA